MGDKNGSNKGGGIGGVVGRLATSKQQRDSFFSTAECVVEGIEMGTDVWVGSHEERECRNEEERWA